MKKHASFLALLVLTFQSPLYGLGLGEMQVESTLDQPFVAEIDLLDIRGITLSNIKAQLADPEYYKNLDIQPVPSVIFSFDIKKNKYGKYILLVHSKERITEPYMQLVIDLTWPKGQLYKVFTVLLDPPGYQLAPSNASIKGEFNVHRKFSNKPKRNNATLVDTIEDKNKQNKETSYGPTATNENIWQIAQRYKSSESILPQVVLAIVGLNPDAFADGNLNGLKLGAHLNIPSDNEFLKVPAELATVEVMAHDKAWTDKKPINHVLPPPYRRGDELNSNPVVEYSQIPSIPKFYFSTDFNLPKADFSTEDSSSLMKKQESSEQGRTLKAEISITTAAINALRESNALLTEQMNFFQKQNQKLQQQLDNRDKEIQRLHDQLQKMMIERAGIAGQSSYADSSHPSYYLWALSLLVFFGIGGGGGAFYYFKHQKKKARQDKLGDPSVLATSHIDTSDSSRKSEFNSKSIIGLKHEAEIKSMPQNEVVIAPALKPTPEVESSVDLKGAPDNESVSELESASEFEILAKAIPDSKPKEGLLGNALDYVLTDEKEDKNSASITHNESKQSAQKEEPNQSEEEHLLEFEPGLHVSDNSLVNEESSKEDETQEDKGLEFILSKSIDEEQLIQESAKEDKRASPLKSNKAFDTLLDLANTYIGMEDKDSAINSLNEVIEYGSKSQKEKAKRLLEKIKGKS